MDRKSTDQHADESTENHSPRGDMPLSCEPRNRLDDLAERIIRLKQRMQFLENELSEIQAALAAREPGKSNGDIKQG
jgi:hypothetical protein